VVYSICDTLTMSHLGRLRMYVLLKHLYKE